MTLITVDTLRRLHDALPAGEANLIESKVCKDAFDMVANPNDWRAAIDAVVPRDRLSMFGYDPAVIAHAVQFMTATPCEYIAGETDVHFRATGYRMGPAGDH